MARRRSVPLEPSAPDEPGSESSIPVPGAVAVLVRSLAERSGLPVYAVITELVLAANRGDVDLSGVDRARYPRAWRQSSIRAWANVVRRTQAAVRRVGPAPADSIADATGTLSVRQVQRVLDDGVTAGLIRRVGGLYEWAE